MFTYGCLTWGPADTACYTGLSLMGLEDVSVAEWFAQIQIPVNLACLIVAAVVFFFAAQYFDRKEPAETKEDISATVSENAANVPKIFAILPILPLLLVLVFSSLICKTIVISVITAVFVSTLVTMMFYGIYLKNTMEGVNLFTELCNGMGNALKGLGMIILFGTLFAGILNKIGGMVMIVNGLANMNMNSYLLVVIVCFLGLIITFVLGTFLGSISMCIPLAATIAASTGMEPLAILHLMLLACGIGVALSPIQSGIIAVAQSTDVEPMDIIKRNAIPLLTGMVASTAATLIFFI